MDVHELVAIPRNPREKEALAMAFVIAGAAILGSADPNAEVATFGLYDLQANKRYRQVIAKLKDGEVIRDAFGKVREGLR